MKKPNFFIVGHTRSSTTSLENNLMQHPEIFVVSHSRGYFGFQTNYKSEQEYLELFKNVKNEKCVGERNTDYIFCDSSASKIKEFSPDAKILLILRNPIDVMHSLHSKMFFVETIEPISDFEEALREESKRLQENIISSQIHPPQILYRTVVKYAKQISKYFNEFGQENVKVLIFDEIHKNPKAVYKEIFKFLGVDSSFVPDFKVLNQNRNPRSRLLQSVSKKNQKFSNLIGKIPGMKNLYLNINLPVSKKKSLNPKLRQNLQKELFSEIKELSELINRDLTYWCKN